MRQIKFLISLVGTIVCALCGADLGVLMAAATNLPDAGKTQGGDEKYKGTTEAITSAGASATYPTNPDGILTETMGRADGDPEMYQKDIDERITKIRPMATPIDQISRYATAQKSDSFEVKYYSVGTRPVKTTLTAQVSSSSSTSTAIQVADPDMFTLDDTIRVVGYKGAYDYKGTAYDGTAANTPDLVLCVCGKTSAGQPIVFAVNGSKVSGQNIGIPENIANGTTLIRMGKSCGELDVQTGRFNNIPTSELQYCQNFMAQIEQSTLDKIAAKEVNWGFSDLEEDSIYDMRLAMENSYLFGDMNVINHAAKDGMSQWFTRGIWWQAGKDIEVGSWDATKGCAVISDDDLVDISKDLFVGTGIGNKRKVLLCGSDMLSALSKIESDKFRLKDTVEIWNLKFKSWETDFGEILTMHDELFDLNGMADCGFALDPEFLTKKTHLSWSRNILDLKKAGVRNTDAVVLQEISCLYLRYAKAHARLKLASEADSSSEL